MRVKSLAQLVLFILIAAFWFRIAWPIMTKEAAVIGAVGGLVMHWATNKGNRNIINIRPLSAGWRVLVYDILLCTFLIALLQQNHDFSIFLNALKETQNLIVSGSLASGIILDYSIGG